MAEPGRKTTGAGAQPSGDAPADTAPDEKTTAAPEEESESVERLLADSSDIFGQPTFVLAGALEHAKLGSRKNLTRSEASDAIKTYLKHEVTGEEQL